uniref:ZSWIM8 TPR repeats domain-containing protein n=1 Tax=Trichobilharzia regenti TaxID=157069 RepID=A0AA85JE06_TRIRE|nr:unnamed protein product [Trichobilharzia regenti]
MSSYSSARTTNDVESDIDFSIYTPSSEFDLDFTFRGLTKPNIYEKEEDYSRKHFNSPESLLVLTAKTIALHFPFEVVESSPVTVPEELQRLIAFHSFPTDEDDIWLYSCLSSGGSYEFNQGEALWLDRAVKECVQIGFHLSATVLTSLHIAPAYVPPTSNEENGTVNPSSADYFNPYVINFYPNDGHRLQSNHDNAGGTNENVTNNTNNNNNNSTSRMRKRGFNIEPDYPAHRVSLTFDRQRITSCSCTCTFDLEERCTAVASPSNTGENNVVNSGSMENIPLSSVRNSMKPNSFAYRPMNTTESNSGMLWQFGSRNESVFANCHTNSRQMPDQPNSYLMRNNLLKNAPNQISPNSRRSWLYNQHIANQNNVHGDLMPTNGQNPTGTWCSHVVATCLMRIRQPEKVLLRAPISESLSKLSREDLQKFAQNLICHVGPRKILPAAQRILDQLLTGTNNPIKNSAGAPDPTLGGALGDAAAWCFDGGVLEEKLRVTLRRFWAPRPVLYSDIGSLSFNLPAEMENFRCILQSRRSSEPRGLWDLLSFIGNMMKRQDNNAVLLLEIVTRCILDMIEVMFWWCTVQTNPCHFPETLSVRQKQTQCGALWLCEEIVQLWRLACLNPELRPILSHANNKPLSPSPSSSSSSFGHGLFSSSNCKSYSGNSWLLQQIAHRLQAFHVFALTQADYQLNSTTSGDKNVVTMFWCNTLGGSLFPNDILPDQDSSDYIPKNVSLFSGFMPALSACRLSWSSEVPPTYGLCATEFFKFMPSFYGAHVTSDSEITDYANVILTFSRNYFDSMKHYSPIELDNYWNMDQINSQLFNNLPLPANHIEFAFSRFQAFDAHGYTEQALQWARYLALLLLYTSNEFINECEQISFEIVGRIKYQTVSQSNSVHSSNRNSNNNNNINSQMGEPSSHMHESYPNNNFQSNNQQKSTSTNSLIAGSSGAAGGSGGIPVGNSSNTRKNARNSRSKKVTTFLNNVNSNRETTEKYASSIKLHPLYNNLSIEYTAKAIRWLDQIRCVMECLSRSHDEFVSNTPSSSINGNTFNIKQTLRGLYTKPTRFETPSSINYNNLRATATAANNTDNSNNHNNDNNEAYTNSNTNGCNTNSTNDHNRQTEDRNAYFIKSFDTWKCIDIELAFRLGFCALKFPRPPCCSPLLEVELFDMEVGLLNRLCLLPIHIACPNVISSIRNEAKQVISGLTLHQKDILVPFNLVTYLFHQLVGVSSSYRNPLCPRVVNLILSLDQSTENVTQNMNSTGLLNILACPILTTGAVLNGSGLPLAMEIYNLHNDMRNNSLEIKKTDYNINVRITSDAELGLQSVISVLGVKSRVPEKLFTYFIEGQRAQEDALALYLFHIYRDDIPKLDRILARLLDRYYNPHFKSPPLWACLNLDSRELMNFQSSNVGYNSVPELAEIIKHENKSFASQNSAISVAATASNPPNTISTTTTINSVKLNSLSTISPVTNPAMSSMSNPTFQSLNQLTEVETVVYSSSSNDNNNNNDKISPVTEINCKEGDDINTGVDEVTPRIPEDKYAYSDMPDTSPVSDGDNSSNKMKQYASVNNIPLSSFDPVSVSEDTDTLSDSKLDNLRYAALCDPRRRMCHFSAVDTSAPETTSSDNSPDAIRRLILVGQKSSAAYTTESSDGGCGDIAERYKQMSINDYTSNSVSLSTTATLIESKNYNKHENDKQISMGQSGKIQSSRSPPSPSSSSTDVDDDGGNECISTQIAITKQLINNDSNTKPCQANYFQDVSDDVNIPSGSHSEIKSNTKRNTNSCRDSESYPLPLRNLSATTGPFRLRIGWHCHLRRPPPQPLSDSMAFHVFQLAKKIREGACGPSGNGSMFVAEPEANDTVHRNLQLVSFQLGLYGLGLFNGLLPSWQNRTFSRNGGWISQQVFEIGIPAACILYHSWQQHLTASELAAISFQLSRENNRSLVDIAAELCLASLSLCNVLRPQELYRALEQCGEHSSLTLERGLLCTEKSVHQSSHGTLPEIYFFLARSWFSLYHSVTKEHEQALNSLDNMNLNQQSLSKNVSEGNSTLTNTPPLSCTTTITTNNNTNTAAGAATITGNSTCNTLLSEGNVPLSNSAIPVREINNNTDNSNNINTNNTSGVPPLCGSTDMGSAGNSNSLNSDLTNAWNYYQPVNLFQPPILRPDHHHQQRQQQPFMYPPSVYPIHPNYSNFSLRQQPQQQQQQQQPQFPPFPYYLNMFNLQQTQPPSQPQTQQQPQQTNNLLNVNNSQPQLQSTHHVPCYLPQTQLVSSVQPNTSYPFGIPSIPQATPLGKSLASVPVQKLPSNYFLHPQFIPNANHPTSPSSQSANLIQSSPFVTIAHQINPSSSLSPTISNNILPCNSYQTYPTDQVIDPSVYAFNPTMVIPNIHPSLVCNVLSNPPQQQHQQSVESITSSSASSINTYNNNGCINTLNLNAITDATVISGSSLSSVISSTLTSTCQLTTSSTASSSVVVHPSMSDQGSILSEGDSCRLTESIADGLGDDNNPNSNNSNGSNEASLNNKEKLSNTSVKSTLSELQALEVKSQTYLVKAFFCAKCAIKKMAVNQSGTSSNFNRQNNTIVVSMPSKNMRGKHYYHMQQNHRGNLTHHFQRRYATQHDAPSSSSHNNNNANNHNHNSNNNGVSVANNNIRSNLINDEVNSTNCLTSENSSSWYFMPSVSSSCGSNQIKVPSSVSAYFNLTNSTTSKSCDSHILWTLDVASSLGPMAVNEYCNLVLQCVTCPLLMEQITARVIDYYEKRMKENTSTTTGTVCGGPSVVGNSCVNNASITNPSFDQHNYFGIQSSNDVISETADKNINFCPNTSRNFADHSHMPNQLWTTLPSMTTSNWPINTNVQNPQDFIPIIPVPYSHSDPNNMASSFNYHSFLPPSIHPSNIPWSHPTGPMNYPVLQQNLYSNQLQENICQFQQMNLNSELNINSNSYINSNKPTNLGHPLNRPPYQTPIQWQMNAQPYIRPFLQTYAYMNSVTPPAATTSSHTTNYTGTDEQTKSNANEFTGRDVVENLINQTHTLFQKYIGQRLQFIGQSQAEWDEFVDLVLKAYNVHLSMPAIDCGLHWNNLLTRIRRHPKCSPALWQRILAGIQTADLKRSA